jgi:voltage-gated sodium channel
MAPVNRNLARLPPWLQKFLGVPSEKIPDKSARTLKRHSGSQYFEQSPHIAEDDWTSLEKAYGLHTVEEKSAVVLPVCERPLFESVIGMTIMLNAICMALEVDLSEKGSPPSKRMLWVVIDLMFCTVFSCEIGFRIHCLGLAGFFMHARYLFDVLLVGINVVDTTVQLAGNGSTGLQGLTALRLLRLFKIVKILRVVSHIKELNLLAKGLASALKSLQWVSLMLALVTFVMSIMFKTIIGTQCDEPEFKEAYIYHFGMQVDPVEKCEEYWGTIFRCMYTLYQVTTLESWSQVIARPIWDIRPHYVFLILVFQLVTTFGLLNIVVAAVVEGTMNSTDEMVVENTTAKETVLHLDILREIFHRSCDEQTKEVSQASLLPILHDSSIRRKLLLLEIGYDDPAQIFRILDTNERGSVNIKELTQGFMRMRSTAKSKDLMAIRALVYRLSHEVNGKLDTLLSTPGGKDASNLSNLNEDLNRRFDRFEEEMRGQIGLLSEAIALNAPAAFDCPAGSL